MALEQSSASVRYWKAKLQILKRPNVWGAAMLLLVPLLFLADYWHNPSKFAGSEQTAPTSADANALPSSTSSSNTPKLTLPGSSADRSATQQTVVQRNSSFVDPTLGKVPEFNLFDTYSSDPSSSLSPLDSLSASPTSKGAQSLTSGAATSKNSTGLGSLSPLQSALDRATAPTESTTGIAGNSVNSEAASDQATDQNQTSQTSDSRLTGSINRPSTGTSQPSGYQPYVPQTSPTAGTTGYTLPPAFRTTTNTPSYSAPSTPTTTYGSSSGSSGYGSGLSGNTSGSTGSSAPSFASPSYTAPAAQPTPFSVPTTPPGRNIGNGQINTFSNP